MGTPASRMITESESSSSMITASESSSRMITASGSANSIITVSESSSSMITASESSSRMITVSGSSGSGHVPTPANRMITARGLPGRGHLPTTMEQFWQMAQNPLSSDSEGILFGQVEKLIEEGHIEDVRKMNIFDAIREKIHLLKEIPSAFHERICQNNEAIAKDPVMKELVREFIATIFDSSSLCNELVNCLRKEKTEHDLLKKVLQKVAPGSPPLGEAQLNYVKEKLRNFVTNTRDPFEGLPQQFESLLERNDQLRRNLEEKSKELSRKSKASRVWSTISGCLMAALTAAAAITCVVAVVVVPPSAAVIGTALGLYATSMGYLGEMMLSSRRKEQNLEEAQKLAEKVRRHSYVNNLALNGIKIVMGCPNSLRDSIVTYVNTYLEKHGVLDLEETATSIAELEELLSPKFDDLLQVVNGCLTNLTQQIEDLKKPLL